MPQIDFVDGIAPQNDPANRDIVGRETSETYQMACFTTGRNAAWCADRGLMVQGYPLARIMLSFNRDAFNLVPGSQFKWNYPQWGISLMILRVLRVNEDDFEEGKISVECIEDIDHVSLDAFGEVARSQIVNTPEVLNALEDVAVIEAPYVVAGDAIKIIPLAAKKAGSEVGYYLHMSIDGGSSYVRISTIGYYNLYGTLVEAYSEDTHQIDDGDDGILIDFDVPMTEELDLIQSITRTAMIAGGNVSLLGDEIISWQNATPITATRFRLTGIFRGRFDTDKAAHPAGTGFWFVGPDLYKAVVHSELINGASRKFKMVPFTSRRSGDISEATAVTHTITARAMQPYKPGNFSANGSGQAARYAGEVVLTWTARLRTSGAGMGDADTVIDAAPTWEGLFEVEVWVLGVLKRTTQSIDDDTWTYTVAMNLADNTTLAEEIVFKLRNYLTAGVLESGQRELTVKHNWQDPVSGAASIGTTVEGTFANVFADDDSFWVINELAATPGFEVDFVFEGVPDEPLRVWFRGYYEGNPAHNVKLLVWNYATSAYINVTAEAQDLPTAAAEAEYYFELPYAGVDVVSGGQLKLRIDHVSNGSSGHHLHIDQLRLDRKPYLYD